MDTNTVTITAGDTDFVFTASAEDFDRFTNEVEPTNKTAAMYNFLHRTVDPQQKDALREVLHKPLAAVQIFGALMEEASAELKIAVKK